MNTGMQRHFAYIFQLGTDLECWPKGVGVDALLRQGVLAREADALTVWSKLP